MNIAIIGTGNIGSGLTKTFAGTRHGVVIAGQTAEAAQALADSLKTGGQQVQAADIATAVGLADVVILAVPFAAVGEIAKSADFAGKIVVDVTNPVKDDFSGITVGFENSAAEEIQATLPEAQVVKAFNTVFAQVYDAGLDFGGRAVPTFVAADHVDAKARVINIARDAGFAPEDAGPLSNARYIEPLGYLNIQFGYMLGRGTQIAPAWLSR